jgi:glycosidase
MSKAIYEINTRVWIKRFSHNGNVPRLIDVPTEYWETLASKGIKYVWLMGVWETVPETVEKYCFAEGLKNEYNQALPEWTEEDVIGSPYAVNNYNLNKELSTVGEFLQFKQNLNRIGLKVILDFIPNHFSADTVLLKTNQEIFLKGNEELLHKDSETFFRAKDGNIYAHGKDPYFPAWQDTVQVNYFSESTIEFMTEALLSLTTLCDGVRCDMAMLSLNKVFHRNWIEVLFALGVKDRKDEFWSVAIEKVKRVSPKFIFIAEAYWDMEWQLQKLGFDFTYDKRLLERLEYGDAENIRGHLHAEREFQEKSVRFIENHDEQRAVTAFGIEKSKAAAIIISTIQGIPFYNDGEFEGRRIKLPVQLGREPSEEDDKSLIEFYDNLLSIVEHPIFIDGEWSLLQSIELENDYSYKNILAWEWSLSKEKRVVVVNYSSSSAYCRVRFNIDSNQEKTNLVDLLNNRVYERDVKEIKEYGLFIHLEKYKSHIFEIV